MKQTENGEYFLTPKLVIPTPEIGVYIRYSGGTDPLCPRGVIIKSVEATSVGQSVIPKALNTFCTLRNADRTFDFSKIAQAFDPEQGYELQDFTGWLFVRIGRGKKIKIVAAPPQQLSGDAINWLPST